LATELETADKIHQDMIVRGDSLSSSSDVAQLLARVEAELKYAKGRGRALAAAPGTPATPVSGPPDVD
jgi:hypothetical protein